MLNVPARQDDAGQKASTPPVVLTCAEVKAMLQHVSSHTWIMTSLW
jgi:hypothetical protein